MDLSQILFQFVTFFIDASKGFFLRFFWIIIILFLVILADDYFSYSYNARINAQIKQISDIENIIKSTKDTALISKLKVIKKDVINKKTVADYLTLSSLYVLMSSTTASMSKNINASPILHYLSSNVVLIIFVVWFLKKSRKEIISQIIMAFAKSFIIVGIVISIVFMVSGWLTAFVIDNSVIFILRLFLNALTQLIIFLAIYAIINISNQNKLNKNDKENQTKQTTTK